MESIALFPARVLIATNNVADAALAKSLLSPKFDPVFTTTDPEKLAGDFVRHLPSVLILAFKELEQSERFFQILYHVCKEVHQHPHRTVVLCSKDEVQRAYELCRRDVFDDYVLFWPLTYDTPRLAMSVHHSLRELAALESGEPSAAEFAAQARHLHELEKIMAQQMAQGVQHIEVTSRAMEQAEQKIDTTLDEFSKWLVSGAQPGSATGRNADDLEREISRIKRDEIPQHFHAAAESARPLKQWAQEFGQECEPLLESARTLNSMAERIRPVVLVVDDDEFQRKIIGQLLEEENYYLVFAANGIEALNALRKVQPDVILMDVMMPDMDGLEATRNLKASPRYAKIPVVMITGNSEGQVVIDSLHAGANDFVVKPFERTTLIAKIEHALGTKVP